MAKERKRREATFQVQLKPAADGLPEVVAEDLADLVACDKWIRANATTGNSYRPVKVYPWQTAPRLRKSAG